MALCQTAHEVLISNPESVRLVADFVADPSIPNHQKFLVFIIHTLNPLSFHWFGQPAVSHSQAQRVGREWAKLLGIGSLAVLSCRPEMISLTR